jgi:hypothetical protein
MPVHACRSTRVAAASSKPSKQQQQQQQPCWLLLLLLATAAAAAAVVAFAGCCWLLLRSSQQQQLPAAAAASSSRQFAYRFMDTSAFMHACAMLVAANGCMRACGVHTVENAGSVYDLVLERVGRSNLHVLIFFKKYNSGAVGSPRKRSQAAAPQA